MKNIKAFICLILALAIPLAMLAGCGDRADELSKLLHPEDPPNMSANTNADDPLNTPANDTPGMDGLSDFQLGAFRDAIDDNGFFKGIRAIDHIEMFKYRGLEIPNEIHQISEEDLESQIDFIISEFPANNQITDRAVEDGDKVNIDYVGSVGGVPFEGGSTEGMGADVTAGSFDYIDDFLFQIIGHMPGETIDVNVTFPEEYPNNPDLAGQPAVFVTTINYIADMELTDDFVVENLSAYYGWTSVAEMKTALRKDMQKYGLQTYVKQYFSSDVIVKSMPDPLIDYQINSMLNYYMEYADYYGISLEELISSEGFSSPNELVDAYYDINMENAVSLLVILAVAEDAGITVSDDDITDYFIQNEMASDYESIVEQYGMPFIKHNVLCQKVIDFVIDNAVLL